MPIKPSRPCRYPGCPHLTQDKSGYCPEHIKLDKKRRRQMDRERGSAAARGYDRRWRKASKLYLNEHPLCALCAKKNPPVIRAAVLVHHQDRNPHNNDPVNLMALCDDCHQKEHASEKYGNDRR